MSGIDEQKVFPEEMDERRRKQLIMYKKLLEKGGYPIGPNCVYYVRDSKSE